MAPFDNPGRATTICSVAGPERGRGGVVGRARHRRNPRQRLADRIRARAPDAVRRPTALAIHSTRPLASSRSAARPSSVFNSAVSPTRPSSVQSCAAALIVGAARVLRDLQRHRGGLARFRFRPTDRPQREAVVDGVSGWPDIAAGASSGGRRVRRRGRPSRGISASSAITSSDRPPAPASAIVSWLRRAASNGIETLTFLRCARRLDLPRRRRPPSRRLR